MSSVLKIPVSVSDHIRGDLSAKIKLLEYGDFQCPHCGDAYAGIKELQKEFGAKMVFIFRNFPTAETHIYAMQAAIAGEAAALQNKFWEMHDIMYENQTKLTFGGLRNLAKQIGLDIAKYSKDIEDENLQLKVEKEFESGVRSGVNWTPSFFINGEKFDGTSKDLRARLLQFK